MMAEVIQPRRNGSRNARRLAVFIVASIALHTLLLISRQHSSMPAAGNLPQSMQVRLRMPASEDAPAAEQHLSRSPARYTKPRQTAPKPTAFAREETAVEDNGNEAVAPSTHLHPERPTPTQVSTAAAADNVAAKLAQLRLEISRVLMRSLAEHFYYPVLARRRGWQGEVLLAFSLDSSGTITAARVSGSSGYRTLDMAALDSLNRIHRIAITPQQELSIELPVVYSLSGG